MNITEFKLEARRALTQNRGKCMLATFLEVLPRMLFIIGLAVVIFFYYRHMINLLTLILISVVAVLLLLFLNAICIPICDTMLDSTLQTLHVDEYAQEQISFRSAFKQTKNFGIVNLIKLRLTMLTRIVKDASVSFLPALILSLAILFYIGARPIPISAAITVVFGIVLMTLLTCARVTTEYSKYRYVYLGLCKGNAKEAIEDSIFATDLRMRPLFSCEIAFLAKEILYIFISPLVFPILHLAAYKKLTLFAIGQAAPVPKRKSAYRRICHKINNYSIPDTIVFPKLHEQ